jgi:DNA-binding LytR/AlgR family response regulator
MSIPLRIVIIHPTTVIARGLMMDLRKIGTAIEHIERVQTLEAARIMITTIQPHVVFLGLNLPNGGAFELLEDFPPTLDRRFAIILVDDADTPPRARQRHLEAMAEHQAVGYLLYPIFHNGTLGKSMEHARNRLQSRMLSERQHDIIERLVRGVLDELPKSESDTSERLTLDGEFSVTARSSTIARKSSAHKKSSPKTNKPVKNTALAFLLTLRWSAVIRLQMKENYYELWYFDTEGMVQMVLVRKDDMAHPSEMPTLFYQAHRSHIVNMKQIAEVNPASLLMRCGNSVPLAESEQQRFQSILQQMSIQVAVLDELRAMIRATE